VVFYIVFIKTAFLPSCFLSTKNIMELKEINFSVEVYSSSADLKAADQSLLEAARKTTSNAYAPYSNFLVGAVALLEDGAIVSGTNQENASYPVGICAERVLLASAATIHPGVAINTMAISYNNVNGTSNHPISPCGMCRQSLAEYEQRTNQPIRIILSGMSGEVYLIQRASQLLPLTFTAADMK
jgi:cytidine deaminase